MSVPQCTCSVVFAAGLGPHTDTQVVNGPGAVCLPGLAEPSVLARRTQENAMGLEWRRRRALKGRELPRPTVSSCVPEGNVSLKQLSFLTGNGIFIPWGFFKL